MSDTEMDKLLTKQAELQNRIEAAGAWDLDRKLEIAADALRLTQLGRECHHAFRR